MRPARHQGGDVSGLLVLGALLKATKGGRASVSQVVEEAGAPRPVVAAQLYRLREEGLIELRGDRLSVGERQRLELLLRTLSAGGDLMETSKLLEWGEFEKLVAAIAEQYSYAVALGLRFKHGRKWWQADVVALKEPLALCIDCKHLRSRQAPVVRKAAELNARRAEDLAAELPRLKRRLSAANWQKATVVPLLVTLRPAPWRTYETMPVVAVNQLRDFLQSLPAEVGFFLGFKRSLEAGETSLTGAAGSGEATYAQSGVENRCDTVRRASEPSHDTSS